MRGRQWPNFKNIRPRSGAWDGNRGDCRSPQNHCGKLLNGPSRPLFVYLRSFQTVFTENHKTITMAANLGQTSGASPFPNIDHDY